MLDTLYKKTNTGAIQYWKISVEKVIKDDIELGKIVTEYGQLDTDKPQITEDLITEGKNPGKKNETTALQQAFKEAEAKFNKQKKKGYVDSLEKAQNEELDELIEGGIIPMLAHKFSEHGHKIKYPCYTQPKLDGIRMIAIVKDGRCTLWSRTRKPITSCPHIVTELEFVFANQDIILDGEAYNSAFKTNFEHIVHLVRQEEPDKDYRDIQYHIYDIVSPVSFKERWNKLQEFKEFFTSEENDKNSYVHIVPTFQIATESQVMDFFEAFKNKGYEGAMLRNSEALYINKRSYDLLKVKEFEDAEFKIIGIEEGRGKLAGHVGSFICLTNDGKEFNAKAKGDTSKLKEYFEDHTLWENKLLTVQYQGLTIYKIPRFPVGKSIRDYE
jgi:ATP-dependent DNA ligase